MNMRCSMNSINKNYHPNKKKAFIIVFGLLIISFLSVFGGLIFRNFINRDYPLVFVDSNNKLMFITKSDNNKNDIASIENANIVYATNDTRYLLYTNGTILYLLDTTVGGVGTKIIENAKTYGFSKDDKFVYYIDENDNLYLYNRDNGEAIYVSKEVSKVELIKDDIVIFGSNGSLNYYYISTGNINKISDNYKTVELNSDGKIILYSTVNNDLSDYYTYNLNDLSSSKVLSNVVKLYDKDNNYTKFIYTKVSTTKKDLSNAIKDDSLTADKQFVDYTYADYENHKSTKEVYEANKANKKLVDLRNQMREYLKNYAIYGEDIFYQNNNSTTLIASNINKLYYYDIKTQKYSYTTSNWENDAINLASYDDIEAFYSDLETKKLNSLYYKVSTNAESMAYKNITTDAKVIIRNNDEYYLLVKDNDYYNLFYSKISNKQIKSVGEIDTNLLNYKLVIDYIDGYLYCNYINGHYYLDMVQDGKVKTIAEDVNPEFIVVSEGKDSIYYLKTTNDNVGDLQLYNGIRTSKLAENIHSFLYLNNDLIYVTKDYDSITKTSDLYRLNSAHLTLIYKNIADWYNPIETNVKDTED